MKWLQNLILANLLALLALGSNCAAISNGTEEDPTFFDTFLTHLNESGYSKISKDRFLNIQLKGSSEKFVSIRFEPKTEEQKANWNSVVNLIARTFVSLIDKAKVRRYYPDFVYTVPLSYVSPLEGTELSVAALKISAG